MCRFVAYLGPPVSLDVLVTTPRNSLIHQSYRAELREEPLNGDGFGLSWYVRELSERPGLFRSITPAWNNMNLLSLAEVTRSGCIFAHVRAATPGLGVSEWNCHPFVFDRYSFMHNGFIADFLRLRRKLLERLSERSYRSIRGTTDSEALFAFFLDRLDEVEETDPALRLKTALIRTLDDMRAFLEEHGAKRASQLNLAVTDGACVSVCRVTTGSPTRVNTLFVHSGRRYLHDGTGGVTGEPAKRGSAVLVASEPLDDDAGWDVIPANHILTVGAEHAFSVEPLEHWA